MVSLIKRGMNARFIIYLIIFFSLLISVQSLSFTTNPSIVPVSPYTDDDLICSWEVSGDATEVNVSWYKDGVLFNQTTTILNESTISYVNTSKNEEWICNVTISNGTSVDYYETSTEISNSPPSSPEVYDWNNQKIDSYVNLNEDQTYSLDINSTDIDEDILQYSLSSNTTDSCVITDSFTGAVTCSPTTEDLNSVNESGSHNISFEVDDGDEFKRYTTLTINILPINDAPYFNPSLTDKSINENEIFNYNIFGEDEENNWPLNFTISVDPALDIVVNITDNTSAIIMFEDNRSASYSEAGNYTVNVTVYDSLGKNTTEQFNLSIMQVNLDPVLEFIPMHNGTQGQEFWFNVYANDSDESNTLNFSIGALPDCPVNDPWNISTTNNSNNAIGLVNITNLSNNHVACRNIRISVRDNKGALDYQDIFLNLTNTNDGPVINNMSYYSDNTDVDINNLTGYVDALFRYKINVTDIDNLTYEGELLNFSNNGTIFNISQSGVIEFTLNSSYIGNYSFEINVTDDGGLTDTKIMSLNLKNNSRPVLAEIGNLSCIEDVECFIVFSATDADNDNLSFYTNNNIFNITNNLSQNPVNTGYINHTYLQRNVDTYNVTVFVEDDKGSIDNETIEIKINNTNDMPSIVDFEFPMVVETHSVNFNVYADDEDYELNENYANISINGINISNVTEYVFFNDTNITGSDLFDIETIFNESSNETYGRVSFTPTSGQNGTYFVNITVTDYKGLSSYVIKNFTVFEKRQAPNITQIRPYGKPYSNDTTFEFIDTGFFFDNITSINFSENRSVLYNITVTDDSTALENLSYSWYINDVFESNNSYLNISYSFFSSGRYNVSVIVEDDRYESSEWLWRVNVSNMNRAPLLMNDLIDLNGNNEIDSTSTFSNYLKEYPDVKFIDPDDDLNENNEIDGNESSRLSYVVDSCGVATIAINNHSITVTPASIGTCNVSFRAEDEEGEITWSNYVLINVTDTDQEENTVYVTTTNTRTREREVEVKEEVPNAIEVIIPDVILASEGEETEIPVILKNNWDETISGIYVGGSVNVSYLDISFSDTYFEQIAAYEQVTLTAFIEGQFREQYEAIVSANVSSPSTGDYATVLVKKNTQDLDGDDVKKNIIFAQDLLSENPECLELNEMLENANLRISEGNLEGASEIINGVIDGCQYLISLSEKETEKPNKAMNQYINDNLMKYLKILIGLILLSVVMVVLLKIYRHHKEKKNEESQEE